MPNINNSHYPPPEPNVVDKQPVSDGSFIPGGRSVSFLNGPKWIDQGIKMILQQPKTWLIVIAIFVGLEFLVGYLPENAFSSNLSVSSLQLIATILELVLFAGVICIAESQRLTGKADISLINNGFVSRTGSIIGIYFIQLFVILISLFVAMIFVGISFLPYMEQLIYAIEIGNDDMIFSIISLVGTGKIIFAVIIVMLGVLISIMLITFAIPLIMINHMPFSAALSTSFSATLKNILPGIAYFISIILIISIASFAAYYINVINDFSGIIYAILKLPFGYLAIYAAYRNIFTYSESLN